MSKLVIIRGNSGSGKTTAAKALQHESGPNTMLLSQDVIRREMLRVKDGAATEALPLLSVLLIYGKNNCELVILEGILYSEWYLPLFELAKKIFDSTILYLYDGLGRIMLELVEFFDSTILKLFHKNLLFLLELVEFFDSTIFYRSQ